MPLGSGSLNPLWSMPTNAVGLPARPGANSLQSADPQGLLSLKSQATRDPKAAVEAASRQFEALFMQELMKSMRQATMQSGMLENSGTQMGTEMLDSQFALKMTGMPGGLSQAIARQLLRSMEMPAADGAEPATDAATGAIPGQGLKALLPLPGRSPDVGSKLSQATTPTVLDAASIRDDQAQAVARRSPQALQFTQQHTAAARAVEAESGIPAAFMIGQAAHETGWGRKEILHADGRSSNNLFGIKAGASWSGPTAEITTTEYIDGSPRKVTAKFRAYASHEESFRDYARLMQTNQRYSGVMQDLSTKGATNGATVRDFATGLQRAGYATDPAYADKLSRVINTTLHLQRALS